MNKKEFDVLICASEQKLTTNQLCAKLFLSKEDLDRLIKSLENQGLLSGSDLTQEGWDILNSHRVDNAVILAAGMSTRFVPLNYETPKGLLAVNGEALIERQIRQLHEKDITDIVIVVGYMREKFEYLKSKYGVTIVYSDDFATKNNYSSIYAARNYLGNTIITSSDLYFTENIFQKYAYDSYYCTIYMSGKTAERGIVTDEDDKIVKTMYGDKCFDIWVTLGYAFYSKRFSNAIISIIEQEKNNPEIYGKFWADIQDEHLSELYMYAKRCNNEIINEFDSLEELRLFDEKYKFNSGSRILSTICQILSAKELDIVNLVSLRKIKESLFLFECKGETYICDVAPKDETCLSYRGAMFAEISNYVNNSIKLYRRTLQNTSKEGINVSKELDELFVLVKDFKEYHDAALPLCAAENVISEFANLPLGYGFQERYIMNNTYSFNMDDNFIGCEKLFPFYQKLSDVCENVFGAKYTDARPFTGMHCIDMITKTICKPGDKMMILSKEYGGHASVKPVVERLGVQTIDAPYDLAENDLDYDSLNDLVKREQIKYILLAPSDLIRPLNVELIDTENCILLYDCSQVMGLIAANLCPNPLKTMKNIIMFGGTHKTFPGPASGLIMTNEKDLHDLMETEINPKYLRHSQMHQKISLLFALIEFEKYGTAYMKQMVHSSNYLGEKLREYGFMVSDIHGRISETHQVHIFTSKEMMNTIYENAAKCMVTLNKKHKNLFHGYGIRLGTQEIARYNWDDNTLDKIALIFSKLKDSQINVDEVSNMVYGLPSKTMQFVFNEQEIDKFIKLMK